MNEKITVTVNGERYSAAPGTVLSEIISGERPCGGHGKCGKCRVVARGALCEPTDAERRILSDAELSRGARLACLARVYGDCEIETAENAREEKILIDGVRASFEQNPRFKKYGVAIDVGTTTVAARLYGADGTALAEAARLNPQSEWGADVISRIEAALGGEREALAASIRAAIDGVIFELAEQACIGSKEIDAAVITGNTTMLSLLTGESVEPLSHAPFAAKRLFGEHLTAGELSLTALSCDTGIYLPPCISAFVGADIACALLASALTERGDTAALVDIGTNGEMALWHNGRLTVTSTAAGPAFEGVGISMGMRGAVGAIDKVTVEDGALSAHVIGGGNAVGVCGSGLVDAVACMLELELIDESGYLEEDELVIKAPVSLAPKDIRMLQLAKSAIAAGIQTVIESEGLTADEVSVLYIAGGFGSYLNMDSAATIGLLPSALAKKARLVGNAALSGAAMLLLSKDLAGECERLARSASALNLSESPAFSEHYISAMAFSPISF